MLAVLCVEDIDTLNNEDNITKLEIEHTFEFPHYVLSGFCGLVWHGTVFDKDSTGKPLKRHRHSSSGNDNVIFRSSFSSF